MPRSADVKSIDALRRAKAALAEFRETAQIALSEAFSESQRTLSWLQHEKRTYWQQQLRRRAETVTRAKSELYRAQLSADDNRASCIEQKKLLQRAEHALEEARQKVERTQRWARELDRELMLFKGRCQAMSRAVDADLPRGEARLELLLDRLDAYVRLQTPSAPTPRAAGAGGVTETEPDPEPEPTPDPEREPVDDGGAEERS